MASLGHPCKFQWVSRLGSVPARHCGSGRQPNFAALNRGRHLYSTGRPSRWALAHILAFLHFLFPRLFSAVAIYTILPHIWCGLSANLRCRSETCRTRLAKNTVRKKSPKIRHLCTIGQFCRAISSQLRQISTIGKSLLCSNISSTCLHNMVNFSPLAAQIGSLVCGTPANFNSFRVLAALLHGI